MDRPDLVSAQDVLACRNLGGGIWHRSYWRWLWSWHLGRQLTQEEADEILSKVNGYGPHEFQHTWASVERSEYNFWTGGR